MATGSALALNIVITNDDGYQTTNIRALYQALKARGDQVIISAPKVNQSGKSGSINFIRPTEVGSDPADADIHYVDGTPVMSMLYGLDVVAQQRFGAMPDLVISGPNEGHNLGYATTMSGTDGAAVVALHRGIPAIAVSASENTADNEALSAAVATMVVKVIDQLETDGQLSLAKGYGLNMNIPAFDDAAQAPGQFAFSRISQMSDVNPVFRADLSTDLIAQSYAPGIRGAGISFYFPGVNSLPEGVSLPVDDDPLAETRLVNQGFITLSVIDGDYNAKRHAEEAARLQLHDLFDGEAADATP
ncbi:5'/3'-nucleotidase SurE [Alcanivorax hongdengensis]|nr:5'/3'-nucleotidase SurE [Alcanivorax hongdengensis]